MSIYVLRYGDLYKVGYSSDLRQRVYAIMHGIPGNVEFVGHMAGGPEVEGHLHEVFAASRFSGEWFRATADLVDFCRIALHHDLPEQPQNRVLASRREEAKAEMTVQRDRLREYAFNRWPRLTHDQRRLALAQELGWLPSRVKALYYAEKGAVLRATEAKQLEALLDRALAETTDDTNT